MGLPVFDKCCFCIDLKTGCFIIGYLSLIAYIIAAIISIVGMAVGGAVVADKTHGDTDTQSVGIAIIAVSALLLFFTVILLTFIVVLLVGLHKNKPGHVKAYLIYSCVYIVITIVMFIVGLVGGSPAGDIVRNIISILFGIYFILVIRSQYVAMQDPKRGPAIYNTA